ncbi:hypothetical protein [Aliihoeflea sp. 40Bstr573]|uniref:hypothetical protein n=1 Tax=Aliihoeflea sp. 40Bstr573 TaxID=2696467 RepID=UPI0020962272|nr:hypothetical protein [Aliihoeflea sp. 40Bstr573]
MFLVVAFAAAASVQPGAGASMSVEMSASSMEAMNMQGCDDCDDSGMSEPSCMTACASACTAILIQASKADSLQRLSHDLIPVLISFGIARTPDPFPPRHSA